MTLSPHIRLLPLLLTIYFRNHVHCLSVELPAPPPPKYGPTNDEAKTKQDYYDVVLSSLHSITFAACLKRPDSRRYMADWRRYSELGIEGIRQTVQTHLPH